jgi:hypothetical protein
MTHAGGDMLEGSPMERDATQRDLTEQDPAERDAPPASFWRGALESLLVIAGFAGFGLAWAGLERRDAEISDYPRAPMEAAPMEAEPPTPSLWLVDGFNVLHAGVLHGRDRALWWTEPRREQLVALAARFDDAQAEIWVVFDGSRPEPEAPAEPPESRVRQVFAPSADDWLLAKVRASEEPACLAVVTADRSVADRARHRGAQVVSPRSFLARCQG